MSKEQDDWDPLDPAVVSDQRKAYDELRERCPVAHSEFMGWSLFRHEDLVGVVADTDTFSNVSRFPAIPNGMDPPEHGRYREALAESFSRENMARLEPRARDIAVSLLQPMLDGRDTDCIQDFVTPFVLKTLCALLGWREELWECLAGWTHGSQEAAFTRDAGAGKALHMLFSQHVKANLDAQRAAPDKADNATAALLRARVAGKPLDDDQIVSVLRNWVAGNGTVAGGLGILLLHLSEDTDLQERLRRHPADISAAIEEILRADGPLVANRRTTTREVELAGRRIPKGEGVALMWIAGNRDPRAFDRADAVDIGRDTADSLVWGQGIHFCLGAPLARLEMRVALEELLSRTSGFTLADPAPRRARYPGNGMLDLHLRISPNQ